MGAVLVLVYFYLFEYVEECAQSIPGSVSVSFSSLLVTRIHQPHSRKDDMRAIQWCLPM